ncbi:MAG: hypothetical protein ACP5OA_05655, partial [Candidatus Woesearchaeota archaeon]
LLVWETDGAGASLSQRSCSPLCTAATSTIGSYADSGGWISLYRNRDGSDIAKLLGIRLTASFNMGSFFHNGTNFTNYGDTALATGDTINTYEFYSFDFIKSDSAPLILEFAPPTDDNNSFLNRNFSYVNVSVTNSLASCNLNWSGTTYAMSGTGDSRYFNRTNIPQGLSTYYVSCNVSSDFKSTEVRTLYVDTLIPDINFINPTPDNDSLLDDITLVINITSGENLSSCILNLSDGLIDAFFNLTYNGDSWNVSAYPVFSGIYSYSVYCNDTANNYGYSELRSLTVDIPRSDAFIAYRSPSGNGINYPKIRFWNSTATGTYNSELELPDSGSPIRQVLLRTSPKNLKTVMISYSDDGYLDGYVCYINCTDVSNWHVFNNFALSVPASAQRTYDFEFETATGNLILIYALVDSNTTHDLAYRILSSGSINLSDTSELYIDDMTATGSVTYRWIVVDKNPKNNSRELVVLGFDGTGTDTNVWVWNGTGWGNQASVAEFATATGNFEAEALRYNDDGSKAMAVGGNGTTGGLNWIFWNGSLWSEKQSFDIDNLDVNDVRWLSLRHDPTSLDFQLVIIDSGSDLYTAYYNDSVNNWTITPNIDTGLDTSVRRLADFSWIPTGGSGVLVWDTDTTGSTLSRRVCSPLCNSATGTINTYAGSGGWITLFRNIQTAPITKIIGVRSNSAFNIGSFYYDGINFTNYGDSEIATGDTINTYEFYSLDFIKKEANPIIISYISPTPINNILVNGTSVIINVSVFPDFVDCILNFSGTTYNMIGSGATRYYSVQGLSTGNYEYFVSCNYSSEIYESNTRLLNINSSSFTTINLMYPEDDFISGVSLIGFIFNISHPTKDVDNCSLIVDDVLINSTISSPVQENIALSINATLAVGNHNWSINCTDDTGIVSSSQIRTLEVILPPVIDLIDITDYSVPENTIILNAGGIKTIYCNIVASDSIGVGNILGANATFYFIQNSSGDMDEYNTHYTNSSCALNETTLSNKTFSCGFDVYYFANNGTWVCNASVYNVQGGVGHGNFSTIIAPLYALNVTDGISFGDVESGVASAEFIASISNLGNMPVNMTVQGYSIVIGDG